MTRSYWCTSRLTKWN